MKIVVLLTIGLVSSLLAGCGQSSVSADKAAIAHETSPEQLIRKGEASAAAGDMTRAEQYFVMAQRGGADPHAVTKWLLLVCSADQRYPVALEYAEQHLRNHPRDLDIKFAAASLHAAIGDLITARVLMIEVLRERPSWASAHYSLASVLRQEGDQEQLALADQHDLEYLKLAPAGEFAEAARDRLRRSMR
jgi:outer membrane protein assembly factor BamD (BamD/ComL family)